jgi:hypothetical protein
MPKSCNRVSWQNLIAYWLQTGRPGFDPRQRQRHFSLASVFRPAVRSTQLPTQLVQVLSPGVKRGRDVTLTTHSHLVPRSRKSRSYTSSPPWRLYGVKGQLYFTVSNPVNFTRRNIFCLNATYRPLKYVTICLSLRPKAPCSQTPSIYVYGDTQNFTSI